MCVTSYKQRNENGDNLTAGKVIRVVYVRLNVKCNH